MRRAAAVFAAAALALAAAVNPGRGFAADSDPEVRLLSSPPSADPALKIADPPGADVKDAAPRNRERAILEFSTVLLLENLRYWGTYEDWIEDWQYELTWDDQKRRLLELEAVRFDSNQFGTNWTHAAAGAAYYTLGRINNLGVKESFLLAVFESVYWESVVEWREVFSVNDTFMTIFGGFSIGEPWYQLARYLGTRPNPATRALGFIHPVMGVHSLLDPASRPRPTERQTLPGYGVFLSVGGVSTDSRYPSDTGGFTAVALRSRLALAPGFTAPGTESRRGWEVLSSTANFSVDLDGGELQEIDVFTRAIFYGRLGRSVGEDFRGSASVIGLGSAFTLFRKATVSVFDEGDLKVHQGVDLHLEEPRDFRDKYSMVHLFGPVYEGYWRGGTLGVSWSLEAYPDFGLINAYALNEYSADHDIAGVKTTLLNHGYYYGYGASVKARFDASAGPVTLGVAASAQYHQSIDALDRFEDEITGDVHAHDTGYRFDATLGVAIPETPLAVELSARWSEREGTVGATTASGSETRYALGVSWRL